MSYICHNKATKRRLLCRQLIAIMRRQPAEPRGEGRVGERHVHATRAADDFDLCIEVEKSGKNAMPNCAQNQTAHKTINTRKLGE
jgi:hypothetical protein